MLVFYPLASFAYYTSVHYFIWKDVQYLLFLRNFKEQKSEVSNQGGIDH